MLSVCSVILDAFTFSGPQKPFKSGKHHCDEGLRVDAVLKGHKTKEIGNHGDI